MNEETHWIVACIIDNYKWVFSGIGVFAISLVAIFFKRRSSLSNQSIRSGGSSTNVQAGRDINLGVSGDKDDTEQK